ncbi:1-deoxy-D-xylulose-5-phosphate synthase [Candidatus Marinimicrobia bacterium]|nr:1-deoxy-D-xylulose-5-phosphate synthase [Candidatus Neomarinimicrobiota bacterium]MDC1038426.1 1-deoxy-D-xylulose-5-phosphate synthase [Candidatus Neomarinimicrobiota bacterium]
MQLNYLPTLNSPEDIRGFSNEQLHELCDELRAYIIDTITQIGGHLAPTLGVIELTVALHYIYNTPQDKLIWDVGHQGYAHKLLTGRFKDFRTIRKFNGLSGFLKRSESEYDVIGAGHASTSISAALGIAEGRHQNKDDFRVAAIIGDGSMTGGLAFEGINNTGHLGRQLLVILNDNEMSISPNVGAISTYFTRLISNPLYNKIRNEIWDLTGKLPIAKTTTRTLIRKVEESLKSLIVPGILFEELGFRYFGPIDGHDLDEILHTLDNIKNIKKPVLLHVLTKKGKGMVSMNVENREYHDDAVKFHAVKPSKKRPYKIEKEVPKTTVPIFQDVFGKLTREIARNRKDTVCVTAAMREGTGLVPYSKEFPDRYYDVGIAEGHGVIFSAGLAAEGIRPIVAIYSTFLQRAFDHIIHDCAIQHLPVIFCMDRSGIAGEDGPTHHGALDIAYMRCIQEMIVTAPKNGNEFRHLLYTALNIKDQPISIRYPKASSVEFDGNGQAVMLPIGSWEVEQHGTDVAILAVGPMVYTAIDASKQLTSTGLSFEVVNCRFIKPMDKAYLDTLNKKFSTIITLEEGTITGGFGDGVASYLLENGFNGKMKKLGLPDSFVEHGSRDELLSLIGLDVDGVANSISDFVGEKGIVSV